MTIGKKLYRTQTTSDSMAWAKEHVSDAPDGSVFLADTLTAAQGRQGRTWSIYPGQLLVTILLKPSHLTKLSPEDLPIRLNQLNMALSVGLAAPLKEYGIRLKWPNDLIAADKKIGGMLMHLVWQNNMPQGIVVGFALNINNQFAPHDPLSTIATSLTEITNTSHNMRELYKRIIESLNHWYEQWKLENFMVIYKAWRSNQAFLGKKISAHQKNGSVITGTVLQFLPNGDMIIIDQNHKQTIVAFYQIEEVRASK